MENVLGVIPGNGKSQGNTGVFTLFCIDHKLCFSVIEDLHPAVKVCKTNATVLAGGFLGCKIFVDLLETVIRNATATVSDGDQKIISMSFTVTVMWIEVCFSDFPWIMEFSTSV